MAKKTKTTKDPAAKAQATPPVLPKEAAEPETPKKAAAKAKASANAKARRSKVKAIKELREAANDKAAIGALNDDPGLIAEAKAMIADADVKEAELGTRAPLWVLMPDGRWTRTIELPNGCKIVGLISDTDGWTRGDVTLTDGSEITLATATSFVVTSEAAADVVKARLSHMITGMRAVARNA